MDVEVEGAAEALDKGHRAGLAVVNADGAAAAALPGGELFSLGTIESESTPGPLGATLVDVRYASPAAGTEQTMPIALHNLAAADARTLNALAEQHEAMAAEYRQLANQATA